jgi:hypothetical protein
VAKAEMKMKERRIENNGVWQCGNQSIIAARNMAHRGSREMKWKRNVKANEVISAAW